MRLRATAYLISLVLTLGGCQLIVDFDRSRIVDDAGTDADENDAPALDAGVDAPTAADAPMDDAPMDDAPMDDAPMDDAPMFDAPMFDAPMDDAPVFDGGADAPSEPDAPMDDAPVFDGGADAPSEPDAPSVDAGPPDAGDCTSCSEVIENFEGGVAAWSLSNPVIETDPSTGSTALHLLHNDTAAGCMAGAATRTISVPNWASAITMTVDGNVPNSGDPSGQVWFTLDGGLGDLAPVAGARSVRFCIPSALQGADVTLQFVIRSSGTCIPGTSFEAWIDDITALGEAGACVPLSVP